MGWRRTLDGPPSRAVRLAGLGILAVTTSVAAAFLLLPVAVRGFLRALDVTVNAFIWFAASLSAGADAWTIGAAIGRALASVLITPRAVAVIAILVLIGALALYGLQRLLGFEEESSR